MSEVVPSPVTEMHNPHEPRPQAAMSPSALLSPTLSSANTLKVNKRQSSFQRTTSSVRASFGRFTNAFVREQHSIVRRRVEHELGHGMHEHIYNTSYEGLLQWIKSERLMRLPHKGGSWDRVLIAAQYFAEQVHHFHHHIETFTEDSDGATNFVFGQCLLLLDLGHENAAALEKAFELFYQFGLDLSPLLQRADLFHESRAIMEDLGKAFADLLQIVTGVSITFYQAVHSGRPVTKIDIFSSFSSLIETFRLRVHRCSREMWDAALANHGSDGRQVDLLQRWLAPTDSVLAFLSTNHISIACRPEQFTCTWFQPHLAAFVKGRENVLLVEGKVGSGKTTLANWIVDRLQRPINRRHVSTVSFFYDYSIAAQSTPLAMLRTLFNQLLSARIGNIQLFNAANQAYMESKNKNLADQEATMWRAFSKALEAVSSEEEENLVIIIDGVTESDSHAQEACKKLHDLALKYLRVRMIQLSQPTNHKVASSLRLSLSTENMIDDIRTLIRRKLHVHQHFSDRDVGDQEGLIERIAAAAEGSMLRSYLFCKLLQRQHSHKDFDEMLKTLLAGSVATGDLVRKLFVSLSLEPDCKSLLSVLMAAERPLHLSEVEALFSVHTEQLTLTSQPVDIQSSLHHLSSLVLVSEGLVAIRHSAIRQALLEFKSDSKFAEQLRHRHQDMLVRLFVATKISLSSEHEPTFNRLDISQTENKLRGHPLLEYTVRYWTLHMKKIDSYKPTGDMQLPKEFKSIFSQSVNLCLLEEACWSAQFFVQEVLELQNIAYRVRKALFGQNHTCVLQSAIFYASICEGIISRHTEAIEWYALCARISSTIGKQTDFTIACCNIVLRISETSITKKRTSIMNYREEVLLIMVTSYKVRYGSSSKELLEIYKRLHEFYLYLEEETKVTEIIAIIQQLTVVIYGSHSDEAQTISRRAQVQLKKREHTQEVDIVDDFIFRGYTEEIEESLTIIRVEEILREALILISREEFERAEELYIELWLGLGKHCSIIHSVEWHEIKIRVMVIYAEFLVVHKRYTEASAILVAIWTEYEHHEFSMIESIILLFKRVALCMREVKLLAMSLLVYQRCYTFFKHEHKEHSVVFKEIETQISIISSQITKTETKTVETSSETVIRSVFESSLKSETITTTTMELCESLVSIYRKHSRWSEAVTSIRSVVSKSWSSFFSESIESITMIEVHRSETIKLIISLAECYIEMKKLEMAEEIYIRLYYAQRSHHKIDSTVVIEYRDMLLHFYRRHEMFTRTISFYQEILVDYRHHCGVTHHLTIEVLYALAQLCRRYQANYGYWLEYYLEIVTSLNKGAHICHKDAFKALIIIAEHYYETLRFSESLVYFRLIFATFCKHGLEYKYFESISEVKLLIKHYFHSIEESRVEIHEHIRILKELREACYKYYGASHEITLHVTITVAETCERSEHYQFEAISYYEEIVKHSSTVSKEIVTRTERSLKTLYVKQVTSSKSTTVTKETLERATSLVYKRYTEIRKDYSCSHEVTLTTLRELVMMYHKQFELKIDIKAMELAIKELQIISVDIVTKVTSARELIEAATTLAQIYLKYGLISKGFELIKELKLQVIYKWTENCSHWGFNVISIGRESFAFIAAFEYYLHVEHKISLTLYMSDLVAEYLFYNRLVHYIKAKKQTEMVFMCAARLCQIYIRSKRLGMFTIIEHKVLHYFVDVEKLVMKHSSKESVQVLISVILKYFSEHSMWKSWTAAVGYAAVSHLKVLLKEQKHKAALDLTRSTFWFLMAHEGLDDPTEITLGFQLCLMMAGRTDDKSLNHKSKDAATNQGMMDLSKEIIKEVFLICEKFKFNLVRCKLEDLNSLIILLGEQKDYGKLHWLLELLWSSREGQSTWSSDVVLSLGKRLVQALFAGGDRTKAIRLCENIVYNVRRVHGVRHYQAISFNALLASMYTSLALKYNEEAGNEHTKNKTHARDMSRVYFKKAIQVHEEVLKQIVNTDEIDDSDCDDDESDYTDMASARGGLAGPNGHAAVNGGLVWASREQEIQAVKSHIRRLQLAIQRYGGFVKPPSTYEKLTGRVWETYHKDPAFKMGQDQVLANKWKVEGYGSGKAEGEVSEDEFRVPAVWWIIEP